MASAATGATGWYKGRVKAVPSGDCLVIVAVASSKPGPLPEKSITLSSLIAPRLARRGGVDEPFAWESREYLRKLCIGKEVTFRVDYNVASINRDFGTVFLGEKNVGVLVVSQGWAKVREQGQQKGEVSPYLAELLRLEEQAKQEGLGRWSKVPGAAEASIRNLPPSAIGDASNFDAMGLLAANKGSPMEAIVEQVRDGSTLRVYLLPEFQFVQVFVAGIQSPQMGRRAAPETVVETELTADENDGDVPGEPRPPLTSAQRLAVSSSTETAADPFGPDAKFFTEMRVLNRDVRIVLEGVDKFSNLIGSVYYPDGESAKDLALELVENGYAKYVEWSANMMEEEAKRRLKTAELEAKKSRLRMWTNYVPPASNSKAIHNQNFTGKVVEVVSGDCIIVADDSIPYGSPLAERRVNLSSIRCPKVGNPRRDEKPAPYAREAKEFLRTRLLGRQVNVEMEYSRKIVPTDGSAVPSPAADSRVMDFGSVFLLSATKADSDDTPSSIPSAGSQPTGVNVGELVVGRGFGTVIRHRDFEERSNYYDALLTAESRALSGRKGIHSAKDPPVMHITDLTTTSAKKAKDFLPFLHRSRRVPAVVEYVLSGHRFKLLIPKETCSIAFALSGVRCPGRGEPYSEEAIALMRRKIMQRDVEIEVETVDRNGTFLGSLWESRTNVALTLLEAGLAKLQTSFGSDRIPEFHLLDRAEQSAKKQKLKIWENFVEGEEVSNGANVESKQQEVLKVIVTEVLGGGKFYVQTVGDQKIASIQQQLAALNLKEAPVLGAFSPKKGDIVLCYFHADKSWYRAMVVNTPRGPVESPKDIFEVFYIDYGNQEQVAYSQLRPLDQSVSAAPGLAQLCSLAYIKSPSLEEDFGQEAAEYLSELTLSSGKEFRAQVEERDTSGGKVKGQGRNAVPGLGVSPILGNAGSRITSSMGNMVGGGNIGRISSGGLSVSGLASRLNLSGGSGSGGIGVPGQNRLMSGVLPQGSPQVMSMLGNSYPSAGGQLSQSHVQALNNLNSMGMLNDLHSGDSSPFDINEFPQLTSRPSSAGGSQGQLGSLRKQGLGGGPIGQQNQEFRIESEDFPALPGYKGGSADFAMDMHQKEQLHDNPVSMMQSQHFPMGRSTGFSLGGSYSSHRSQQQQQHAPSVSSSGVSFSPVNNQDLLHLHGSDIFPSSHSTYHSQTSGPPGIGIRPPNSPNTISGVGSYDQLIQQYQQHQNQSQFRFQQMSAANQSFRDQSMKSMQTVQSSPDPFGLLGLLSVIRMSDPDLTSLALGVDLTTLGLNLNSSENLHKTFASPWSDEPAKSDPEFTVLQCYNAKQPPALHQGYFSKFSVETLFYIFYSMPRDEAQLYAAHELYKRGWFYHKEHRLWFIRVPNMEPLVKTNAYERGSYHCFDPSSFKTVQKDNFVLYYEMVEKRPLA